MAKRGAQSGVAPRSGAVAPPPGLGAPTSPADRLSPVKVDLGASAPVPTYCFGPGGLSSPTPSPAKPWDSSVSTYAQQCGGQGEWVNAVINAMPYLNAQGLQQALGILDHAITNIQQVKALDGIISDSASRQAQGAPPSPYRHTAELLRLQTWERQQVLLRDLHNLQHVHAVAGTAAARQRAGAPLGADSLGLFELASARASPAASTTELVLEALTSNILPGSEATAAAAGRRAGAADAAGAAGQAMGAHPQQPGGIEKSQRGTARPVQTLSTSLQLLSKEDPNHLFIVRRINKLGFKAARKLKVHFSGYGNVVKVLVAHSTVRQHGDPQSHARRRPSSLGFVHMASAEAVLKILAAGEDQEVDGSFIRIQRFERQSADAQALEECDGEDQEDLEKDGKWEREQTGSSGVSTTASTTPEVEA